MIIAFGVYEFDQDTVKLQPWLTIREIGKRMVSSGWDVHVITNSVNKEPDIDGITIHQVKSLRQTNSTEVISTVSLIKPDKLILLSSPLNLIGDGWLGKIDCEIYAFLSYPFYSKMELIKALPHLIKRDFLFFLRYLLLPNYLWSKTLKRNFTGLIAQSERTVSRVSKIAGGALKRFNIDAGIDTGFWLLKEKPTLSDVSTVNFLYVGSAKSIRGFDILLHAFSKIRSPNARLKILARGSTVEEEEYLKQHILKKTKKRSNDVEIQGGWIDADILRGEIQKADCVVLPFVLVPSELPVSVLECISCGTPVVASDINGLPEAVGRAGIIVKQASARSLLRSLEMLCQTPELLNDLAKECSHRRDKMIDWDDASKQWMKALS